MSKRRKRKEQVTALHRLVRVFAVLLMLVILSVAMELPLLRRPVERDSGIHMTAGREILAGRVMYRDLWENRTPGIHYANALAFRLFGPSLGTVHACNAVLLTLNAFLFVYCARVLVGGRMAVIFSIAFVIYLGGLANRDESNAIEIYMLIPMVLTALCGLRFGQTRRLRWAFLAGLCTGIAVIFKQPAASAGIAVAAFVCVQTVAHRRPWHEILKAGGTMALGCTVALTPMVVYFQREGALGEMWSCLVTYNRLFTANVGFGDRISVLWYGLVRPGSGVLLFLGFAGILGAAIPALQRAFGRAGDPAGRLGAILEQAASEPWWVMVFLWAAADLFFVCYTGFHSPHYFLQIVPSWGLLGAGFLKAYWFRRQDISLNRRLIGAVVLFVALLLVLRDGRHQIDAAQEQIDKRFKETPMNQNEAAAFWIRKSTRPEETICVWGAEADIYFHAKRRVASRYFFTYPLQMPDYDNERRIAEFLRDLRATRPAMIADASVVSDYSLPLFGSKQVSPVYGYDKFDAIRQYVLQNYVQTDFSIVNIPIWIRQDLANRPPLPVEVWSR